tara:strand:- start:56 stop:1318 length:1263 start_codon:yes stop_codon:yes gene_type:complete
MIKAQAIGKTIVAFIGTKMYNKEFATIDEKIKVYEELLNLDETVQGDLDKAIKLFEAPLIGNEQTMLLDFEAAKKESEKHLDILDFMKDVKANGHQVFEVVENSLIVKGINISTPDVLIRELMKAGVENNTARVDALLNFWKLCVLNPDPRARFDLFKFIRNHDLTITPSGYFIAYRTVNTKRSGDTALEKFITQEYLKVKKWKKAPKNYTVYKLEDNTYISTTTNQIGTVIYTGNLQEMYENIGELSGNVYTDAHTGTFNIKIGEVVQMDRNKIDPDPVNSCSYGLHLGNLSFMEANMGYFGKTGIVCLCNPKNVTAVPEYDSGKMRTCEYLPIAIAELDDNGKIVSVETDVFEYEYAQHTLEELEAMKNLSGFALEEFKKHEFIAPEINYEMLKTIYTSVSRSLDDANSRIARIKVKI